MEGVVSCSHCIQDDRHVMWSMLTGNEVACTCLYMYSAVDVGTSKRSVCEYMCRQSKLHASYGMPYKQIIIY